MFNMCDFIYSMKLDTDNNDFLFEITIYNSPQGSLDLVAGGRT